MLRFFWPTRLNPDPNAVVRFGRVLHWIGTAIGVLLLAATLYGLGYAVFLYITNPVTYHGRYMTNNWLNSALLGWFGLVFSLLIFLAGRALRYIFSGE